MKRFLFILLLMVSVISVFSSCTESYREWAPEMGNYEDGLKKANNIEYLMEVELKQKPLPLSMLYGYDMSKIEHKIAAKRERAAEELSSKKFNSFCEGYYLFHDSGNTFELEINSNGTASIKMNGEIVSTEGSWKRYNSYYNRGCRISVDFPDQLNKELPEKDASDCMTSGDSISYDIHMDLATHTMVLPHTNIYHSSTIFSNTVYKELYENDIDIQEKLNVNDINIYKEPYENDINKSYPYHSIFYSFLEKNNLRWIKLID